MVAVDGQTLDAQIDLTLVELPQNLFRADINIVLDDIDQDIRERELVQVDKGKTGFYRLADIVAEWPFRRDVDVRVRYHS